MTKKQKIKDTVVRYLLITFGCFCLGAGIALFLDPNMLAPGGVSGLAIILSRFIPLSTGLIILILNVPLLILGLIKFGKEFLFSTVYATVMLAVATDLMSYIAQVCGITAVTHDLFLAALFGGALSAIGLGIVFRNRCTTGGLDIIVKIIHTKHRHLGTGTVYLIVDIVIAAVSAIVFRDVEIGLYACVGIVVQGLLMDVVIYGGAGAKFVYIISCAPDTIKRRICDELEIGATEIEGEGGYTGEKKRNIMCVAKNHLYPKVRDIVREEDPSAFMIVNSAREVYGLGFRDHHEEL